MLPFLTQPEYINTDSRVYSDCLGKAGKSRKKRSDIYFQSNSVNSLI